MASSRRPRPSPGDEAGADGEGPRRLGGQQVGGSRQGAPRGGAARQSPSSRPVAAGRGAAGGGGRPGNQQPARGRSGAQRRQSGAQRRYDRARRHRNNWIGWGAVAVVLVVLAVILAVKFTGSSSPSSTSASGADRNPAAAPAAYVRAITSIPASVYDSVGTDAQPAAFVVLKNQPPLTLAGKPRFVYVGGEYCPYCAVTRYSMVAALSRFGTFSGLKETASGPNDGDIPTFSFVGSTYKSPYLAFTPYETADRLQNPLQTPPSEVGQLYATYDGNTSTGAPSKFANGMWSGPGIPFLDIANRYIRAGASSGLYGVASSGVLANGGPGRQAIANAIHDPSSPTGKAISADQFIADANYFSAAICGVDGGKPTAVCASPGVTAATQSLAKVKPVG